jgi:hypothetical protein
MSCGGELKTHVAQVAGVAGVAEKFGACASAFSSYIERIEQLH